jgi:hypothetical protein
MSYPETNRESVVVHLQHEREKRSGQSGVPTALGLFVSDKRMLSLDFQELCTVVKALKGYIMRVPLPRPGPVRLRVYCE